MGPREYALRGARFLEPIMPPEHSPHSAEHPAGLDAYRSAAERAIEETAPPEYQAGMKASVRLYSATPDKDVRAFIAEGVAEIQRKESSFQSIHARMEGKGRKLIAGTPDQLMARFASGVTEPGKFSGKSFEQWLEEQYEPEEETEEPEEQPRTGGGGSADQVAGRPVGEVVPATATRLRPEERGSAGRLRLPAEVRRDQEESTLDTPEDSHDLPEVVLTARANEWPEADRVQLLSWLEHGYSPTDEQIARLAPTETPSLEAGQSEREDGLVLREIEHDADAIPTSDLLDARESTPQNREVAVEREDPAQPRQKTRYGHPIHTELRQYSGHGAADTDSRARPDELGESQPDKRDRPLSGRGHRPDHEALPEDSATDGGDRLFADPGPGDHPGIADPDREFARLESTEPGLPELETGDAGVLEPEPARLGPSGLDHEQTESLHRLAGGSLGRRGADTPARLGGNRADSLPDADRLPLHAREGGPAAGDQIAGESIPLGRLVRGDAPSPRPQQRLRGPDRLERDRGLVPEHGSGAASERHHRRTLPRLRPGVPAGSESLRGRQTGRRDRGEHGHPQDLHQRLRREGPRHPELPDREERVGDLEEIERLDSAAQSPYPEEKRIESALDSKIPLSAGELPEEPLEELEPAGRPVTAANEAPRTFFAPDSENEPELQGSRGYFAQDSA